ncbi:MAG: hypothetical protein KC620_13600, partial [Myxococcales bacterium]|nr:hypothetical protein [Myxococcales bacterium]
MSAYQARAAIARWLRPLLAQARAAGARLPIGAEDTVEEFISGRQRDEHALLRLVAVATEPLQDAPLEFRLREAGYRVAVGRSGPLRRAKVAVSHAAGEVFRGPMRALAELVTGPRRNPSEPGPSVRQREVLGRVPDELTVADVQQSACYRDAWRARRMLRQMVASGAVEPLGEDQYRKTERAVPSCAFETLATVPKRERLAREAKPAAPAASPRGRKAHPSSPPTVPKPAPLAPADRGALAEMAASAPAEPSAEHGQTEPAGIKIRQVGFDIVEYAEASITELFEWAIERKKLTGRVAEAVRYEVRGLLSGLKSYLTFNRSWTRDAKKLAHLRGYIRGELAALPDRFKERDVEGLTTGVIKRLENAKEAVDQAEMVADQQAASAERARRGAGRSATTSTATPGKTKAASAPTPPAAMPAAPKARAPEMPAETGLVRVDLNELVNRMVRSQPAPTVPKPTPAAPTRSAE